MINPFVKLCFLLPLCYASGYTSVFTNSDKRNTQQLCPLENGTVYKYVSKLSVANTIIRCDNSTVIDNCTIPVCLRDIAFVNQTFAIVVLPLDTVMWYAAAEQQGRQKYICQWHSSTA
jgi:hypothetical protein